VSVVKESVSVVPIACRNVVAKTKWPAGSRTPVDLIPSDISTKQSCLIIIIIDVLILMLSSLINK
jgi:hypothetical protein